MWKLKASALHGAISELKKRGLFNDLRSAMPAQVQRVLDQPPARTDWIRATDLAQIDQWILETRGAEYLRTYAREAAKGGTLAALLPLVQGVLRLFGANPHTILVRVTPLAAGQAQGIHYSYEVLGDRKGRMCARYDGAEVVPSVIGTSFAGLLLLLFELCPTSGNGSISEPTWTKTPTHTDIAWDVQW